MSRRTWGFTLTEMLVAMVILLLFMGAIYGTYSAATQSITRVEDQQEVYQTGRVLLAKINNELTCAYQSASTTAFQLIGEDTPASDDGLQQDTLTFLTTAYPAPSGQPAGDLCQVKYEIGDGSTDATSTPTGLYVEENVHPGLEVNTTDAPERKLLSPLVVGVNFLYLPVGGTDWVYEWGSDQTTLPMAIRVELTLQPRNPAAKPVVMTTTANLMMATTPSVDASGETPATGDSGATGGGDVQP